MLQDYRYISCESFLQCDSLSPLTYLIKSKATNLHFVRCIKSNDDKAAYDSGIGACSGPGVMRQLLFSGVLETIKIRRQGYPTRAEFAPLWQSFSRRNWHFLAGISPHAAQSISPRDGCSAVLNAALNSGDFAIGHTKIFAKYGALEAVEQWARGLVASRLVAFARGRVGRLRLIAWRRAKFEARYARELPLIKSVQAVARAARARTDLAAMLRDASLLRAQREAEAARLGAEKAAAEARRKAQLEQERARARLYDAGEKHRTQDYRYTSNANPSHNLTRSPVTCFVHFFLYVRTYTMQWRARFHAPTWRAKPPPRRCTESRR